MKFNKFIIVILILGFTISCEQPSKKDNTLESKEEISLADKVTYGRALETAIWFNF